MLEFLFNLELANLKTAVSVTTHPFKMEMYNLNLAMMTFKAAT